MLDRIRALVAHLLAIEPVLVIAGATGALLILANVGLPVAGVDVPALVEAAFNILALIGALIGARQAVYSPATHEREVAEAELATADLFAEE